MFALTAANSKKGDKKDTKAPQPVSAGRTRIRLSLTALL